MSNPTSGISFLKEELDRFFAPDVLESALIELSLSDTLATRSELKFSFQGMECEGKAFTAVADADNYLLCLVFHPRSSEKNHAFTDVFPDLKRSAVDEHLGFHHSDLHLSHLSISNLRWVYPIIYCDSVAKMEELWNKVFFQTELQQEMKPLLPDKLDGTKALQFLLDLPFPGKTIEFVDEIGFGLPCFFGQLGPRLLTFLQSEENVFSELAKSFTPDAYGSIYSTHINYFNLRVPLLDVNCGTDILDRIALSVELISPTFYLTEDAEVHMEGRFQFKRPDMLLKARGRWWPQKPLFGLHVTCRLTELPFFQMEDLPGLDAHSADMEVGAEIILHKEDLLVHSLKFELELDYWALLPGVMELEHLQFEVEIYQPESLRLVLARFNAALVIGPDRLRFLCSGQHPEGLLDCALDPATPIYMSQLIHALTGKDIGIPSHLRISQLNGSYNYQTKQVRFDVEISSEAGAVWELHGFQLNKLRFGLSGTMPDVSVYVKANMTLGANGKTVNMPVLVRYQGKDRGWLFEGSVNQVDSNNLLSLTDFVHGISGGKLPMPSGNPIVIDHLHAAFYSQTKAFNFDASASKLNLPVPGFDNGIQLENLALDVRKAETLYFRFNATTRFPDLNFGFSVAASYGALPALKEKGWHIKGNSDGSLGIQDLLSWLGDKFKTGDIQLPDSLKGLAWSDINFELQKGSSSKLSFGVKASGFKLSDKMTGEIQLSIDLERKDPAGKYEVQFTGTLLVENPGQPDLQHRFRFSFQKSENTYLALTYQGKVSFHDLVGFFAPETARSIPGWINPSMEESVILWSPGKKEDGVEGNILFCVKMNLTGDGGLDLSRLEFVGDFIPPEQSKLVLSIDLMLSQKPIKDTSDIKELLSGLSVDIQLPETISGLAVNALVEGPFLGAGKPGESNQMSVGIVKPSEGVETKNEEVPAKEKTKWKEVNKKLGPVRLRKVGFTMEDGKAKILLDGGLEMGGFAFDLLGFGVKVPIRPNLDILKEVEFGLEGMELNVKRDSFTISGGFRRQLIFISNKPYNGYAGELRVMVGTKSLTAFGGYVDIDGTPSFFIYAVALLPLGGPAEFFIDGFAGGIGINSSLNIPPIEGVRNFLMVKAAFGESYFEGEDTGSNLSLAFHDIPPRVGSHWVALGVKANHYKFVESFMLAAITVGDRVEIELLGLARLKMPKGAEKLVKAELAIHARLIPEEGTLCIDARITDGSYVFNPMAKLSGGFAFYTWFSGEHAGDFVITLGGYAPSFKKPDHYPSVPRLALTYQVTESIYIKGSAYFALNPRMLMAGGRLEGNVDMGWIQAWFTVEAHFLMNFQPYQYFISSSITVGATFTVDLWFVKIRKTVSIGAQLELWGPDFGGYAVVDLAIFDLTIHFGKPKQAPRPVSWATFRQELLPPEEDVNRISISRGMVKELKAESYGPDNPHFIVNPTELEIAVETNVPAKKIEVAYLNTRETKEIADKAWPLGIGPMGLSKSVYKPSLHLSFTQHGHPGAEGNLQPVDGWKQAPAPAALWGTFMDRKASAPPLLGKATGEEMPLTGATLRPAKDQSGEVLPEVDMKKITAPDPDILLVRPQYIQPIEQTLNKASLLEKTSMLELIRNPDIKVLEQLKEMEVFSHLPYGDVITFRKGGIFKEDIEQFEDEPLLGVLGARNFLYPNLKKLKEKPSIIS